MKRVEGVCYDEVWFIFSQIFKGILLTENDRKPTAKKYGITRWNFEKSLASDSSN